MLAQPKESQWLHLWEICQVKNTGIFLYQLQQSENIYLLMWFREDTLAKEGKGAAARATLATMCERPWWVICAFF